MMNKRFKKFENAVAEFPQPEFYGTDSGSLTIISFGSTKLPIFEAIEWLKKDGIRVNFLKVSYLNPFPVEAVMNYLKQAKKTLLIENNFSGQFEGLLRERTGFSASDRLRKYDGRPFYPEEIFEKVKSLV